VTGMTTRHCQSLGHFLQATGSNRFVSSSKDYARNIAHAEVNPYCPITLLDTIPPSIPSPHVSTLVNENPMLLSPGLRLRI